MKRYQALGRMKQGTLNRTEQAYAEMLEQRRAVGEVLWFKFEAIKLRLADNTHYGPDFLVMLADGSLEVHEVKGGYITPDGWMKLKIAAEMYPFRFMLAVFKKKEWRFSYVGEKETA